MKSDDVKYDINWAKKQVNPQFLFFWGHHKEGNQITKSCLSQWWSCTFTSNNIEYNCAEQYMMSEKAKFFKDDKMYDLILKENSPAKIKKYGRQVKNYDGDEWDKVKFDIVVQGNILKFSQNKELKEFLINTENKILVEASPYDKIWGIGLGADDPNVDDIYKWRGKNLLGFALMKARDYIKKNG